jgi:succinate dehydrogenase subunit C
MSRRPYIRPVSRYGWYLRQPRYLRYMSREVTCIFIGAFALFLICVLDRLAAGPAAYDALLASIRGPWGVIGLLLVLAFSLHNAISWFNVTPKAMPVQIGDHFLPGRIIVAAHYAVWIVVSLAALWLAGAL